MSELTKKAKTQDELDEERDILWRRWQQKPTKENAKALDDFDNAKRIRLEDAKQQEQALLKLLKEEKDRYENNMIMVLWKERQVWKQKLQQLIEYAKTRPDLRKAWVIPLECGGLRTKCHRNEQAYVENLLDAVDFIGEICSKILKFEALLKP